jgi:hypothetical protein
MKMILICQMKAFLCLPTWNTLCYCCVRLPSITMPTDWEVQFNSSVRTVKGMDAPAYRYNASAKAACEPMHCLLTAMRFYTIHSS